MFHHMLFDCECVVARGVTGSSLLVFFFLFLSPPLASPGLQLQPLPLILPHTSACSAPPRPERAVWKVAGRFFDPSVKHLLRLTALRLMKDCGTKGNANSSPNYKFNVWHTHTRTHTRRMSFSLQRKPPSYWPSVNMKINENKLVEFFAGSD